MKKCLHCGTEMPNEDGFCSECGAVFTTVTDNQVSVDDMMAELPADNVPALENAVILSEESASEEAGDMPAVIVDEIKLDEVPDASEEEVTPVAPIGEKVVDKKKNKWWHIAIPAVLIVAIAAGLLLGPFFIYLAPKAVLANALSATFKDLSARAEGTPLAVMGKAYDESQRNTMTMNLEVSQPLVGDMRYEIVAKIDSSINQNHIDINADILGKNVDMNLYMDREVAAVNMNLITGKNYYGIYYDTFSQDIRSNEFMYNTIGEENVARMEEAVDTIDQIMSLEAVTPEQQTESLKEYGEVFLAFVEESDVQVGKAETSVDGKATNCKTIACTISAEEYADLMLKMIDVAETDPMMIYYYQSSTMDFSENAWADYLQTCRDSIEGMKADDGVCMITFCLYGGKVVQIGMAYQVYEDSGFFTVNFGSKASVKDIIISGEFREDEDKDVFEITLSTEKDGDVVTETLYITEQVNDDDPFKLELGYEWSRESGDMRLYFREGEEEPGELECVFEELENGYRFSIPKSGDLIALLGGDKLGVEMSADISVTAGAEIEAPQIKDIAKLTELGLLGIAMKFMDFIEL